MSSRGIRRLSLPALAFLGLGLWASLIAGPARAQEEINLQLPALPSDDGSRVKVMVELMDPPVARVYGNALVANRARGKAAAEAAARQAGLAQLRSVIEPAQARFDAALRGVQGNQKEIFRVKRAMNAYALEVDADKVAEIRRLPGVRAIYPLIPEVLTNSTSVPFIGAPRLWENSLGLGLNLTGQGMRIGIIDTGIDYQHASFGGTGLLADYQANDRTVITDTIGGSPIFPTAKVVGGTDFAGDAYTGSNSPAPDPDPMDCNGHGSHVSGSAAGFGVNADGTTFTGPYTSGAPFAGLRIGPGVAPGASLYGLRVFGCTGSTTLTVQAIDWATDPNDDGDLSDHLDVINMSLGSAFGSSTTTSVIASENAVMAGVIVVTSAGNSGDTYFITGSPGAAGRAIATASAVDSGLAGVVLNVNAPATIAGPFAAAAAGFTDPTAPAPPAPSGQTGNVVLGVDATAPANDGCEAFTNAAAIAGNVVLVDRGTCGFVVKAQNAAAAGAIGMLVANNVPDDPTLTTMTGASTVELNFPSIFVSMNDGNTLKANIAGGLNVTYSAATAGDLVSSFSSRGPRRASSPIRLKPDIAAPGQTITSVQTGVTCTSGACQRPDASGFLAGSQPLNLSGTSMASPHIAGTMALFKQLHPDWTIEELKALVMNGADHDPSIGANGSGPRYGPSRTGSGRTDLPKSAVNQVIAFNADDPGLVSVSFNNREIVGGPVTEIKRVRLVNHGDTDQSFTASIATMVDAPGVSFSLPGGSSVSVPAGGSTLVDVQMTANAAAMDHVKDATMAPTQAAVGFIAALGNLPRAFLGEESSILKFTRVGAGAGAGTVLRVPLYVPARATSDMSAPSTIATGGAASGSTTIPLSGTDVCTGTLGAGPVCTGTFPTDEVSLVTPLELQAVSPRNTNLPSYTDIQYAGVAFDPTNNRVYFGVSTWGEWSSPTDVAFKFSVDFNEDGTWDRVLISTNAGSLAVLGGTSTSQTDTFMSFVLTPPSGLGASNPPNWVNLQPASALDTRILDNNVLFLWASPTQLALPAGDTTFRWKVETCFGSSPTCTTPVDAVNGPFFFNTAAQGLSFGGSVLRQDLNGSSIPVTWNTANMAADGTLGALLLHHHNGEGKRAEVVLVEGAQQSDLAITKTMSPSNPQVGDQVTFTLTVTNNGPDTASGIVVTDLTPQGLTYVSDNGGGAFSTSTDQWTVPGSLANGASASLQIVETVDTTDPINNVATITSATPLDPNAANNTATVTVQAPRQAELELTETTSTPTVLVGAPMHFTLTVHNNGSDTGFSVNVSETLPSLRVAIAKSMNKLTTTGTPSVGTYNSATGVWSVPSLGSGATATLDLTAAAPNMAGTLTHDSTVTSTVSDPDTSNNSASAQIAVQSPSDVVATKSVSGSFVANGLITYTLVITNNANFDQQDNTGDELTDVLPASLTLISASATSGTAVATVATRTVTWSGSIPAHGSVTVTIQARINTTGTVGTTISNQATIHYDANGDGSNEASRQSDNPTTTAPTDPTTFAVEGFAADIPTLGEIGLAALVTLLGAAALFLLYRKRAAV